MVCSTSRVPGDFGGADLGRGSAKGSCDGLETRDGGGERERLGGGGLDSLAASLTYSGPLIERNWGAQPTPAGATTVSRARGAVVDGASHLSFCRSTSSPSATLAAPLTDFLLRIRMRQNAMPRTINPRIESAMARVWLVAGKLSEVDTGVVVGGSANPGPSEVAGEGAEEALTLESRRCRNRAILRPSR